ncbi:VOC family protein [Paracoccus aminovorans]|uniref:VOC family protein n=1 Tax=Paracoccus aminovorans TaxID=34004 RepID=UPI002B257C2B|nr:VOC family protein [Paracoccus aminovorans]
MIDHIGISVSDLARSRGFYDMALAPLGIAAVMEVTEEMTGGHGAHLGYGRADKPFFWIGSGRPTGPGTHVAFAASDRAAVAAFHAAALAAGGRDTGAPGLRPEYHPGYYGAFVLDPDGNNIEAVHHGAAP